MDQATVTHAATVTRPTSVRWKIFILLLVLVAINYIDRASLSVALPVISAEFNLSPAQQATGCGF